MTTSSSTSEMAAAAATNPLSVNHRLPPFSAIKPEHIKPAIEQRLNQNRERIRELLATVSEPTWDNFIAPMEAWDDELSQAWSPVGHLNGVLNSDELRDAYNACLPLLSQYSTEMGQNKALCDAYKKLRASAQFDSLSTAQKTAVEHALRDFHLAGVDLPDDKKARYGEIRQRLSELTSKFGENVLDATNHWSKLISDKSELAGLPDSALDLLAQQAKAHEQEGYRLTLDFPSYMPVLTYGENRSLREEMYTAYVTRASDQGPDAGKFDNSQLMNEILTLRYELAQLLGFESYAHYSVETKMAGSPDEVLEFLSDLAAKAKPQAEREFAELKAFAAEQGCADLQPWDVSFYSEKLRQARYAISQEDIRPYLPVDTVINGMFEVVSRLYGLSFEEQKTFDSYHPDARFFHVLKDGEQIAAFYLDLYARPKKRGGAWMDDCRIRRRNADGSIQLPVAYLVCNFTPPVGDKPALLTHDELTTLFHEFGHGLHHMLTQIDVAAVSGINGVAWDAVELPSQFLENWCYEPEALAFISGHYETGEPLPQELLDKLLAAKHFQSAMMTMRQQEFALFDFRLHHEFREQPVDVQQLLNEVRAQVAVVPIADFNRFQHSFSHIFAGGYAAGYYSYKWAEVLSADAYSRFEEEGIFNRATGESFLQEILSQGGSREAAVLFENFRGRKPSVEPLLRHSGIVVEEVA